MRRAAFILVVLLVVAGGAAAQSGGQLCLRSYEDRNLNGRLDANEVVLQRGVSVNLLDASGVTIQTALLDNSPNAGKGVICFQQLPAGQYTLVITSADYTATTPDNVTTTITEGGLPIVVEFGAQLMVSPTASAPGTTMPLSQRDELVRIMASIFGTLVVVTAMLVLGLLIYWLAFRNRAQPSPAGADPRRTTGTMAAVRSRDTDEFSRQ